MNSTFYQDLAVPEDFLNLFGRSVMSAHNGPAANLAPTMRAQPVEGGLSIFPSRRAVGASALSRDASTHQLSSSAGPVPSTLLPQSASYPWYGPNDAQTFPVEPFVNTAPNDHWRPQRNSVAPVYCNPRNSVRNPQHFDQSSYDAYSAPQNHLSRPSTSTQTSSYTDNFAISPSQTLHVSSLSPSLFDELPETPSYDQWSSSPQPPRSTQMAPVHVPSSTTVNSPDQFSYLPPAVCAPQPPPIHDAPVTPTFYEQERDDDDAVDDTVENAVDNAVDEDVTAPLPTESIIAICIEEKAPLPGRIQHQLHCLFVEPGSHPDGCTLCGACDHNKASDKIRHVHSTHLSTLLKEMHPELETLPSAERVVILLHWTILRMVKQDSRGITPDERTEIAKFLQKFGDSVHPGVDDDPIASYQKLWNRFLTYRPGWKARCVCGGCGKSLPRDNVNGSKNRHKPRPCQYAGRENFSDKDWWPLPAFPAPKTRKREREPEEDPEPSPSKRARR